MRSESPLLVLPTLDRVDGSVTTKVVTASTRPLAAQWTGDWQTWHFNHHCSAHQLCALSQVNCLTSVSLESMLSPVYLCENSGEHFHLLQQHPAHSWCYIVVGLSVPHFHFFSSTIRQLETCIWSLKAFYRGGNKKTKSNFSVFHWG